LLGEIGVNICEKPGMSGLDQFAALSQHISHVSDKVKAILLTTFVKLYNLYPEQTSSVIQETFSKYSTSSHLELQQRSCEYMALTDTSNISADIIENVLNTMPAYELDENENVLLAIASGTAAEQGVTDRSGIFKNNTFNRSYSSLISLDN
jgi:hypothetical protein